MSPIVEWPIISRKNKLATEQICSERRSILNNLNKRQKTVAGLRAGNSFYIVPGRVQFCAIKKNLSDQQLGRSGK